MSNAVVTVKTKNNGGCGKCKCPCHTSVPNPGPHISSCKFSDPDYTPPDWPPKGIEIDVSEFDGVKPLPIDTVAGIMQKISKVNAKARAAGKPRQCPSTFTSGKRSMTTTFCTLDEGHEGEHRGYRKRWPNTKKARS